MRQARLAFLTLLLAIVTGAASASAAEPIEGIWQQSEKTVVEYFPAPNGGFTSRYLQKDDLTCPDQPRDTHLTGSGRSYTGSSNTYRSDNCQLIGRNKIEITVAEDGQWLHYKSTPPGGFCCVAEGNFERRAAAPPAQLFVSGDLPAIVNTILVDFQREYKRLRSASGPDRKRRYAAIRSKAAAATKRVKKHNTAESEKALKSCALKAFAQIAAAAKKAKRQIDVGKGLTAIAKCLAPYRDLFPNDKPGTEPKRGTPSPPTTVPKRWQGIGAGSTKTYTFPRILFELVTGSDGVTRLQKLDFAIRMQCFNGGGGMVTSDTMPAMGAVSIPLDGSRSFKYAYNEHDSRLGFEITGTFDSAFKSMTGTLGILGRDCKAFYQKFSAWPAR